MSPAQLGFAALLAVAVTVMVVLLADAFVPGRRKAWLAVLGAAGLVVALGLEVAAALTGVAAPANAQMMFYDAIAVDGFAVFFQVIFLGLALLVMMLSPAYLDRHDAQRGEFYVLVVAALAGMMLMVAAGSLLTIFLGVELLSIALYILCAFLRRDERSQEAGLKYLLIGGFASGFLLYGFALLFGGTGTTSVRQIALVLPHLDGDALVFSVLGAGLILVGLAFKASAAPFHTWTPDVYEGAPAPVVAFMSVGTKVAAIAVFLRLFAVGLAAPAAQSRWAVLLGSVAALSMIVGAVGALQQTELKRMLAYSSVAQAGYLLLAVVAGGSDGLVGGAFFLAAYGVMTFGAFGAVTVLSVREGGGSLVANLRGLGYRSPVLGALLALFLLSLAGVPATIGFWGKLFVLEAAVHNGYAALAMVAVVSSAISLYYYLRVVVIIYTPAPDRIAPDLDPVGMTAVAFAGVVTLLVGFFPALLYDAARQATLL